MPQHTLAPDIPPADDLGKERRHLDESRAALRAMREHASSLSSDMAGDWVSRQVLQGLLDQRVAALADHPDTPLFFGRLDRAADDDLPPTLYVGRRHVHDGGGRALVIDWRAPVSRAFYQASPAEPMGVDRRRRFGYQGGQLTAFEDEDLAHGGDLGPSRILTDEIERPRSGPMRDIVATIQPDQDEIVRADLGVTVCVQGAPGTGKTAVGLHRAAYLLFTHREKLSRAGVMIVGPNRAFLSYISSVLPALGEVKVDQTTVAGILGDHAHPEDPAVSAVKGDARMAAVLKRAMWLHVVKPTEGVLVTKGANRYRVADYEVREIVASLRGTTRYNPGRAALAQRLAHQVLVQMERRGESPDDRVQDAVARSKPVKAVVDQVWPKLVPEQVLFRLLADPEFLARAAKADLTAEEQAALVWAKPYKSHRSAKWSGADAALLDELADLMDRTPPTATWWSTRRRTCRRCSCARSAAAAAPARPPSSATSRRAPRRGRPARGRTCSRISACAEGLVTELTLGFRVPREVLDYAARLLPGIAPELAAPRSLRPGAGIAEAGGDLRCPGRREDAVAAAGEGSVGVIVRDADAETVATALGALPSSAPTATARRCSSSRRAWPRVSSTTTSWWSNRPTSSRPRPGALARLYVVLTRAVTTLTVVHARPLPEGL